jgi:hypothetical protein
MALVRNIGSACIRSTWGQTRMNKRVVEAFHSFLVSLQQTPDDYSPSLAIICSTTSPMVVA